MQNFKKALWGVVLIIVGIVIAINSLGIANIDLFFDGWWTLFIIVPCVLGLFEDDDITGNIIGIFIGVVLLLCAQDILSYRFIAKLIVPFILVCIGTSIVVGELFGRNVKKKVENAKEDELENIVAVFNEEKRTLEGDFKGSIVDAVFGHVLMDLTNVKIDGEATIKASAIFGGIDIIVPKDTIVKVKATKVLGGVSKTNTDAKTKKNADIIYIEAFTMFGGIDIK